METKSEISVVTSAAYLTTGLWLFVSINFNKMWYLLLLLCNIIYRVPTISPILKWLWASFSHTTQHLVLNNFLQILKLSHNGKLRTNHVLQKEGYVKAMLPNVRRLINLASAEVPKIPANVVLHRLKKRTTRRKRRVSNLGYLRTRCVTSSNLLYWPNFI